MGSLLAAALSFSALHFMPGTPLRTRLIKLLGDEKRYVAVFALGAMGLLIWLVWSFNTTPSGETMWAPPLAWRWLKPLVVLAGFVLVVGSVVNPNPSLPEAQNILEDDKPVRGVTAITRHPMMWGVSLWAAAHLISQPNLRGLLFFGTFLATALFGARLQEKRKEMQLGDKWRRYEAMTSFVPFAAIAAGRARLSLPEIGAKPFIIALILWMAALHFHKLVMGVSALPQLA